MDCCWTLEPRRRRAEALSWSHSKTLKASTTKRTSRPARPPDKLAWSPFLSSQAEQSASPQPAGAPPKKSLGLKTSFRKEFQFITGRLRLVSVMGGRCNFVTKTTIGLTVSRCHRGRGYLSMQMQTSWFPRRKASKCLPSWPITNLSASARRSSSNVYLLQLHKDANYVMICGGIFRAPLSITWSSLFAMASPNSRLTPHSSRFT